MRAKADFTPCWDGDSSTVDDVCSAGTCAGAKFQCPSKIHAILESPRDSSISVSWEEPEVDYHHFMFAISSTHRPGDRFAPGVSTVRYTARSVVSSHEYTCEFKVEVLESDSTWSCPLFSICPDSRSISL